jgi:hypothetical protein
MPLNVLIHAVLIHARFSTFAAFFFNGHSMNAENL